MWRSSDSLKMPCLKTSLESLAPIATREPRRKRSMGRSEIGELRLDGILVRQIGLLRTIW